MAIHPTVRNGLFISFEGPDCSGKSTQARMLAAVLKADGYKVMETREPGGTRIGEELRHVLKQVRQSEALCDEAELFLFCACRAQLARNGIIPFLRNDGIVICDRYMDSTIAYQGYARGLDLDLIRRLQSVATADRLPDLTFLLDLDIRDVLWRGQMRLESLFSQDRIEQESRSFHEKVRQGYLQIAQNNPGRVKVIDATLDRTAIHHEIRRQVQDALRAKSKPS